ncbi:hypothetical protein RXV94_10635 [Yeosuana sp. MJ-SS3]|uniref:DUF2927 domain-containing protein n=1 Tax=Gilvirhabdus luticola TaxID=3079858 RepID=A0ABU3U8F3_9FLAO|nr:hypothetical protein [Yeosuana sp. MJ-SS3]MDU8886617.1 hypothetical protein [Yeosuana sp. MJ-SS3]
MKNTYVFLIITLLFSSSLNAQELTVIGGHGSGNSGSGQLLSTTPVVLNDRVDGTPYINEKFAPAVISASENNIFYVRYNAVNDEIEVKGERNSAYALNKYRRDITIQLIAQKKTYQNFMYVDSDNNQTFGYFVHLSNPEANIKLLKKEVVKFFDEKVQVTGYDTPQDAKYKRLADKYFIKKGKENAIVIPNSKKEFAKLFPDHEKEVLAYLKSEKIKLKKEESLTQLFGYLNSL